MELLNTISNNRVWNRHGLKIVYSVAILLCLLVLTSISWNVITHKKLKADNYSPQEIAPIVASKSRGYRVDDIVKANLFGNPNPAPVEKVITKTTLDLTLQGILSASDTQMARAIIRSGKSKSELYSIGEQIKGAGVSVEEIKFNEVLLNRNGAIESLSLNKKKSKQTDSLFGPSVTAQNSFENYEPPAGNIQRSTPKPRSANGQRRAIKQPNFSGLDKALKKMDEI